MRQHELPGEISRAIGLPGRRLIVFSRRIVDVRGELITTGKISSRSVVAIGEDEDVSCMGKTGFDPADLVLEIQFLIRSGSSIIRLRVTPAVDEIAAVTIYSSSVACGFFCGRTMVDNPDFVTVMGTEEDLVSLGVVIDGVHVGPTDVPPIVAVDVGKLWMISDDAVVVFGRIEVLDHVIPDIPFPDDVPTGGSSLVDLDDKIGVEIAKPDGARVASFLNGLGG